MHRMRHAHRHPCRSTLGACPKQGICCLHGPVCACTPSSTPASCGFSPATSSTPAHGRTQLLDLRSAKSDPGGSQEQSVCAQAVTNKSRVSIHPRDSQEQRAWIAPRTRASLRRADTGAGGRVSLSSGMGKPGMRMGGNRAAVADVGRQEADAILRLRLQHARYRRRPHLLPARTWSSKQGTAQGAWCQGAAHTHELAVHCDTNAYHPAT